MHNREEMVKGVLQQSVRLYNFLPVDPVNDRFCLSDGTCRAAFYNPTEIRYAESAYVPNPSWRSPTLKEVETLVADKAVANYSTSMGLVRFPQEVLEPFNKLGLENILTREELYALARTHQWKLAVGGVEDYVRSFLVKGEDFQTIVVFNEPGLVSTAYIPEKSYYIGLHVDYLFQQSIHGRDNSANRISVNLGNEDRYLVYVNLTMRDLINIIKPIDDCSSDELVLRFFERFPRYPVVRIRIRPGEAYIAPTQNVIHDGIGSKIFPDIHLTICGHIGLPNIYEST